MANLGIKSIIFLINNKYANLSYIDYWYEI